MTMRAGCGSFRNKADHVEAADARKPQIEHDDIRFMQAKKLDALLTIRCLADNAYMLVAGKDRAQRDARKKMIFNEKDANLLHNASPRLETIFITPYS